uniref:Major facilitator superfamily (MFS) profile domain-containing protein n=1 Tax=Haptolina ericina TaxID=156174 RepID=A0A7S3C231_9EUKA
MQEDARTSRPLPLTVGLRRVLCPSDAVKRALLVAGMGVAFCQQATGVEAAVYYTPETLEAAGIRDESMLMMATVGVGSIKVLFILLAAYLVERHGRVNLLLISSAGISISQILIGASFSAGGAVWLALLGQCLFMAFFSIGSGPCSMLVAAECFPLQVRGLAMGVATLVNRVTSGCIALSFLSLTSALTPAVTYYTFAAIALGACYFIARYVPETKGRALEEVERQMAERYISSTSLVSSTAGPTCRAAAV